MPCKFATDSLFQMNTAKLFLSFVDSNSTISDNRAAGKNLQLFTALRPCANGGKTKAKNRAMIKQFILELNTNNSGIVDSLCKLISTIISNDLNLRDQEIMDTDMLELVTDTINQVQLNLIQDILSNTMLSQQERVFVSINHANCIKKIKVNLTQHTRYF